ncbi:hypothetical protein HaLaN_13557 [Haematococcus lacustris]|uniref:Uncharacterized protein n=1 Tax=Haematococcus lacustris TaxID=44745 RepID=A0A699ZMH9_HAELA|nr:hypothetical protein HaLaN_13557 [Haematococcus lacustris]
MASSPRAGSPRSTSPAPMSGETKQRVHTGHGPKVETDKMFYLRSLREYYKQLPREELVAPQPAQPAATWLGSTWTSAGSSYSPETAMSQDFRTWLPPMQSIHIQSHLQVMGMQLLMLEVGGQLVDRKENRQMAVDSATGV